MTIQVLALSGGVGGAKLVDGLYNYLGADHLAVIANTADDFEHCGFYICPDIDTLLYTLAGLANPAQGWGRADETWSFMEELRRTHPDQAWFQLGDKDLETHRYRTRSLADGATLTEVTGALAKSMGVAARILPMSDHPVRTHLRAEIKGSLQWMAFQEYFVKLRCEPTVHAIEYRGATHATLPELGAVQASSELGAVIIGPSNPFLSIDPIRAVRGMEDAIRSLGVPVIAVSPIVAGRAIKGPAAKLMQELNMPVDVVSVAHHYRGLVRGMVIDQADRLQRSAIEDLGMEVLVTNTVMQTSQQRVDLARDCLEFARRISGAIND